MNVKQGYNCLIGRHHRDGRNVYIEGERVLSRCVHCGVGMVKQRGTWRALRISRVQFYALLLALVLLGGLAIQHFTGWGRHRQDLVVFVGDSITEGVASRDPMTLSRPGLYQTHVGNTVIVANEGINGITLGSLAGQVSKIEDYYRSGRRNVVIIEAGSNDFALGAKAAPLFKILQDYSLRLRDGGWTVGVGTVMPRNGLPPVDEKERQAYNRMIVTGPLRAQGIGILDYDAEHRAGRIEIADGVHPTDVGYVAMSKIDTAFADKALDRR